jgi:hypothetical protein
MRGQLDSRLRGITGVQRLQWLYGGEAYSPDITCASSYGFGSDWVSYAMASSAHAQPPGTVPFAHQTKKRVASVTTREARLPYWALFSTSGFSKLRTRWGKFSSVISSAHAGYMLLCICAPWYTAAVRSAKWELLLQTEKSPPFARAHSCVVYRCSGIICRFQFYEND